MYTQGINSPELLASLTDAQVVHYGAVLAPTPEARADWNQRCAAARAVPPPPALLLPAPAVLAFRASEGSTWAERTRAAYVSCPGWTHLEYIAASGPTSAFGLSLALDWVFLEKSRIDDQGLLVISRPEFTPAFSFEQRCQMALMSNLLAVRPLD